MKKNKNWFSQAQPWLMPHINKVENCLMAHGMLRCIVKTPQPPREEYPEVKCFFPTQKTM